MGNMLVKIMTYVNGYSVNTVVDPIRCSRILIINPDRANKNALIILHRFRIDALPGYFPPGIRVIDIGRDRPLRREVRARDDQEFAGRP